MTRPSRTNASYPDRVIAWDRELILVHQRLRDALQVVRNSVNAETDERDTNALTAARQDLQVYCHGFCAALAGHHTGEDTALFPALGQRFPDLRPAIDKLEQDHRAIAALLADLEASFARDERADATGRRLDGIAAIMESHFGFEERTLLGPLASLDFAAPTADVLGPL